MAQGAGADDFGRPDVPEAAHVYSDVPLWWTSPWAVCGSLPVSLLAWPAARAVCIGMMGPTWPGRRRAGLSGVEALVPGDGLDGKPYTAAPRAVADSGTPDGGLLCAERWDGSQPCE